ncbi:MAG: hypothetical protein ACRC0V_09235 [Fusobacteriaceae bacterium]
MKNKTGKLPLCLMLCLFINHLINYIMGWKNIEKKFNIQHIVQIRDNKICIGSGYIGDIITISFEGKIIKMDRDYSNEHLKRYVTELREAERTGELKKLIDLPDTFENLKPIYTCEKGRVIKKFCEEYEYPNVCTDGDLIYENTFFVNRKDAVKYCCKNARLRLKYSAQNFGRKFTEMGRATKRLFIDLYEFIISFFN